MSTRVTLLSVPITLMRLEEAGTVIDRFLAEDRLHRIVTVNPEFLVAAHGNTRFRELLSSADLATADGAGIIFAARFRGHRAKLDERITGVALTRLLLEHAEKQNHSVLIVLKSNSLTSPEELAKILHTQYPLLRVTALREPIPTGGAREETIVLTALGAPAQEFWISDHADVLARARIAVGVGGTFDFISGTMHRAPGWLRNAGLEWLWRLALEPKRILRIFRATIIFPYLILRHRL